MAKSVWFRRQDILAFEQGKQAAGEGLPRTPARPLQTYNERAAFNDGWDTVNQPKGRAPKAKKPPRSFLDWPSP